MSNLFVRLLLSGIAVGTWAGGAVAQGLSNEVAAGPKPAAVAPAGIRLVESRESRYSIVLAADAPGSVKVAAAELKQYVRSATGADLPIAPQVPGAPDEGNGFISLGDTAAARAAGLTTGGMPAEGYRIAVRNGNLFILGPDTPDGATTPAGGTSSGTLNGVYVFLEDYVGVRWLMPGPEGEDVPSLQGLTVPADLDRAGAPAFQSRHLPYVGRGVAVEEWTRRMRLGGSLKVSHSHNWQETVPPSLFAEHPEWFAEVNGVRVPPAGRYKLETTNPQLVEYFARKAIAAFDARPDLACFSLSPSDSGGWSQSKESRALYEQDPKGKLSVTRLILSFYNDVARKVRVAAPGRMVAGYVYSSYLYPPKGDFGGSLEPNLFLVCAPSPDYGYTLYRPDVRDTFDEIVGGWGRLTTQLGYYDLPTNLVSTGGVPTANGVEILRFIFPRLRQYGVRHVYVYGVSAWGSGGMGNYLKAKLMWDPGADVEALAREYLARAYGPDAGPRMARLYAALDDATRAHYQRDGRASYTMTPDVLRGIYADAYPRFEGMFLEAKSAPAGPRQAARLAMYEHGMLMLHAALRRGGHLNDPERSPFFRTDEQTEQLRKEPAVAFATGQSAEPASAGRGAALAVRAVDPAPRAPAGALAPTPFRMRGASQTLLHVDDDEEVRVVFNDVPTTGEVIRYAVRDSLGRGVADGLVRPDLVVRFAGNRGQTYVMDVSARSAAYAFRAEGCRYAVRGAGSEPRGMRLLGRTTPLYVHVPPGAAPGSVAVTLSSASPGETAAADIVSPSGEVVGALDTSAQPAVRLALPAASGSPAVEGGYWTIRFKAPRAGTVDDVNIDVTGLTAGQWFGLDPSRLLAVEPLKAGENREAVR